MDLAEVSALVTGAGSGIGAATATALAAAGARVLVADVDAERAAATASAIRADGGEAVAEVADVSDVDDVQRMVDAAVHAHGGLQIAVNNAGMNGRYALTADCPVEQWRRTVDVNLTGVFLCMRAEIPHLLAAGGGAIVNTSSGAGLKGFPGLPAYVASKHGVVGLTKAAALEYAAKGLRVNAVCPGTVHTPMLEEFTGHDDAALQAMGRLMPMRRLGSPEEVARAIAWLCSPAAAYVTGHMLAVDGGAAAT